MLYVCMRESLNNYNHAEADIFQDLLSDYWVSILLIEGKLCELA